MHLSRLLKFSVMGVATSVALLGSSPAKSADLKFPVPGGTAANNFSFSGTWNITANDLDGSGGFSPDDTVTLTFLADRYDILTGNGAFEDFESTALNTFELAAESFMSPPFSSVGKVPLVVTPLLRLDPTDVTAPLPGASNDNFYNNKIAASVEVDEDPVGNTVTIDWNLEGEYSGPEPGLLPDGFLSFNSVFSGPNLTQVVDAWYEPGGTNIGFQASGSVDELVGPSTPEPSNMAAIGLVLVGIALKKRKQR